MQNYYLKSPVYSHNKVFFPQNNTKVNYLSEQKHNNTERYQIITPFESQEDSQIKNIKEENQKLKLELEKYKNSLEQLRIDFTQLKQIYDDKQKMTQNNIKTLQIQQEDLIQSNNELHQTLNIIIQQNKQLNEYINQDSSFNFRVSSYLTEDHRITEDEKANEINDKNQQLNNGLLDLLDNSQMLHCNFNDISQITNDQVQDQEQIQFNQLEKKVIYLLNVNQCLLQENEIIKQKQIEIMQRMKTKRRRSITLCSEEQN